MALHVVISFPVITHIVIHLSFLIVIASALFRSPSGTRIPWLRSGRMPEIVSDNRGQRIDGGKEYGE